MGRKIFKKCDKKRSKVFVIIERQNNSRKMKLIYLASPYGAKSEFGIFTNILNAHLKARELIIKLYPDGFIISPCSNSAFFGGEEVPEKCSLDGDFEIIKRCDAIFLNKGWENSKGCKAEKKLAESLEIPIFTEEDDLEAWAKA